MFNALLSSLLSLSTSLSRQQRHLVSPRRSALSKFRHCMHIPIIFQLAFIWHRLSSPAKNVHFIEKSCCVMTSWVLLAFAPLPAMALPKRVRGIGFSHLEKKCVPSYAPHICLDMVGRQPPADHNGCIAGRLSEPRHQPPGRRQQRR